ncbi:MAG: hypothetical protein ABW208_14560 [Pyrinomonadaceae bacterium]
MPVSGTYIGIAGNLKLVLRVDVDGTRPLEKLSGDIFGAAGTSDLYLNSFQVEEPQVNAVQGGLVIEGTVSFARELGAPFAIQVGIPFPADKPDSYPTEAYVLWAAPGRGVLPFLCGYAGPVFRTVFVESAFEERTSVPLVYDTHSNPDRPDGLPKKNLSVLQAYADAGVYLAEGGIPAPLSGWEAGLNAAWSDAELHAAMEWHFKTFSNVPQWRLFLIYVSRHEMSGYIGLMYDSQDAAQRQGCAVFTDHSYLKTGTEAEQARSFLWASVHETGHCFNLLHSFAKGEGKPSNPADLSWMNYPYLYDQLPEKQDGAFWKDFPFQFTDGELHHLRHADLYSIIMGGFPLQMGGGAEYLERLGDALPAYAPDPADIGLRVQAKEVFQFGEPVIVELSLRPPTTAGAQVPAHSTLNPSGGFVSVLIKKPSGRVTQYRPLLIHNVVPEQEVFAKNTQPKYESAYIGYGKDGFYFADPGEYQVVGVYKGLDGRERLSPPVTLHVEPPPKGEETQFANALLGRQQGQIFYFDGSDMLPEGAAILQEHLRRQPNGAVARHIHRVIGTNAARSFKFITPQKKLRVREANVAAAIRNLSASLQISATTSRSPLDNLTFGRAAVLLTETQVKAGREPQAQVLADSVTEYFASQGLRKDVLRSIRTRMQDALKADDSTAATPPTQSTA